MIERQKNWHRYLSRLTEKRTNDESHRYDGYQFLNPTPADLFTLQAMPWDRRWRLAARAVGFDLRRLSYAEASAFYGRAG